MTSRSKDLQDKEAWCAAGEVDEGNFIRNQGFDRVVVLPNVEKARDKYTHDMRISFPSDLKTVRSSWIHSQRMFGLDPKYAISLNRKDVERYNKLYPNIVIVFDIEMSEYNGVHWADLHRINTLIRKGMAKEHSYKDRVDDNKGNAKSSYVFDCRWFPVLHKSDT